MTLRQRVRALARMSDRRVVVIRVHVRYVVRDLIMAMFLSALNPVSHLASERRSSSASRVDRPRPGPGGHGTRFAGTRTGVTVALRSGCGEGGRLEARRSVEPAAMTSALTWA